MDIKSAPVPHYEHRNLQLKPSSRIYNIIKGPYINHNFIVHCGIVLDKENGKLASNERFWNIFPSGGKYSVLGDTVACGFWYIFLLFPFVAIAVGCVCKNQVNIINSVILCLLMMFHLISIFQISKNVKKFKRMWNISKVDLKKYLGLQNVVLEVDLSDISDLELIPGHKRKKITQKLSQHAESKVVIMLCSNSFWTTCYIEPVICLALAALSALVSIIIQLETMRGVL